MSTPSFATASDRVVLTTLWLEAFEDEPQEVDAFFDRFDITKTALVMREDDRVVSMLFLLPTTIILPQETRSVGYIYGGATFQNERGKGYYRRLLSYAQDVARDKGMKALFLHPADEALDDSYVRMGFSVPLVADESAVSSEFLRSEAVPLSMKEYAQYRRRLLNDCAEAYVDWDDAVLLHCGSWCRAYAFSDIACALISDDGAVVYEYISACDDVMRLPQDTASVPARRRSVGTQAVVGRLFPLDEDVWDVPVYMGYGME